MEGFLRQEGGSQKGVAPTRSSFRHQPLPDPAKQIRLLTCANDVHTRVDHLDLRIETYHLHEAPSYAAVSYTWNSSAKTLDEGEHGLKINGETYPVQQNLKDFLEHFDHSQWKGGRPQHCWLWIDALCIDQNSASEKNAQVALMGQIFQNAAKVFAWLGGQSVESTEVSLEDLIMELSGRPNDRSKACLYQARFGSLSLDWRQAYLSDTTNIDLVDWRQHLWKRLESICDQSFWRRVWIRQEVWMAADVVICYGNESVVWAEFEAIFVNLKSQVQKYKNHYHVYYPAWVLSREVTSQVVLHRQFLRMSLGLTTQGSTFSGLAPLRNLLEACQGLRSTLLHDRIYGLVGLATDGHKIPVDYSKTRAELYLDTLAVTQYTKDIFRWNRTLLEYLDALHSYDEVAKAVTERAQQDGDWHIICEGTSRSFVLDASHCFQDNMIAYLQSARGWTRRSMFNPPSWIDAWTQQHGDEPLQQFPDPYSDDLYQAEPLELRWTVQSNFAAYVTPHVKQANEDSPAQTMPLAVRSAIKRAPNSWTEHVSDAKHRRDGRYQGDKHKLVLGSLGEVGIATQNVQEGDLIVHIKDSVISSNMRPVHLLARQLGEYFAIVGRVFFRYEGDAPATNPAIDREGRWPAKEMQLYLDIRTLHRLAMRTSYGG